MRWTIAGIAVAVGLGLLFWSGIENERTAHDFARDIGLSLCEVALSVAIIDTLIERAERKEDGRKIAWSMLEELDHVCWVWLGGHRRLDLAELRRLLAGVHCDPIPYFTENLFLRLGSHAGHTRILRADIVGLDENLVRGLTALECLAGLRDGEKVSCLDVAKALKEGAAYLAKALRIDFLETPVEALPPVSDERSQYWRLFGQWPDAGAVPLASVSSVGDLP